MQSLRILPDQDLRLLTRRELQFQTKIYYLINTPHFYLDFAFIVAEQSAFRLLAYDRQGKYLIDKRYTSSKGAKIAFLNHFGNQYYKENPIAQWTPLYPPDEEWVRKKKELIDSLPAKYKEKKARGKRVSFLTSPKLFSQENVFIIDIKTGYRLIVHNLIKEVLFDDIYKNVGGAKMSFRIMFGHKSGDDKPEPIWGPFSQPNAAWWKKTDRFIVSHSPEFIKRRKKK